MDNFWQKLAKTNRETALTLYADGYKVVRDFTADSLAIMYKNETLWFWQEWEIEDLYQRIVPVEIRILGSEAIYDYLLISCQGW